SASASGISYSNSIFAKPVVFDFTVRVARRSQILTRTFRAPAIAIKPSLISCWRMTWLRQLSSRTRNFLSISTAMFDPRLPQFCNAGPVPERQHGRTLAHREPRGHILEPVEVPFLIFSENFRKLAIRSVAVELSRH